jgi:hypothetical protein
MSESTAVTPSLDPIGLDYAGIAPIALKFAFRIRIYFKERRRFEPSTPMGGRVYVPPAGGDISGPRLQGKVLPYTGADWARGRADGAAELNAHYMLEASDGTPIYIHNRGFLYGRGADGKPLPRSLVPPSQKGTTEGGATTWSVPQDLYFFCIPEFDAPYGPHEWLTRTVILGRGVRIPAPDHTCFDYYTVDNA